jgi:hypothetical protein
MSGVLFGLSQATIAVGLAFLLLFSASNKDQITYTIYKNDIYGADYGASAFASEVILRYLFSAATPLFWVQAIDALHIAWSSSLLGFISLTLVPVPWLLFRYGPYLRSKSSYVPIRMEELT